MHPVRIGKTLISKDVNGPGRRFIIWFQGCEMADVADETDLNREEQVLKSPDILAVKGLAQFRRFPAAMALGNLIAGFF